LEYLKKLGFSNQ